MAKHKKIVSILLKVLIGVASFFIVWYRLKSDFTESNVELLKEAVFSGSGILSVIVCLLLIPVNWGIESYKWMIVTQPVEAINFATASRSVYSGICLGNLAPGRATEFIAKIIFFKAENRPQITVLHFINGMFQLSVTYLIGFIALAYKLNSFGEDYIWIAHTAISTAVLVILVFIISLIKIDKVLSFISHRISKQHKVEALPYRFTGKQLSILFGFSLIRYFVFFTQMILLIHLFGGSINTNVLLGTALYFLITTTIPMISFLEAAIRAAVALVVFKDTNISNTALALSSVSVWLINIILPSIIGYFILLKQNFDFRFSSLKK
ncbi:MAG: hypothetical protein K0S32_3407 [Bacteroidetes bacterium]|nr:hypothetical protein [Bacteroidota bacterium]